MTVAFCCATDGKPKYLVQIVRWAQSFRLFIGDRTDSDLIVGLSTRNIPPAYLREFKRLGVIIVDVPLMSDWHGPSNKLGVLQHSLLDTYDYVILTDCDIAFADNPFPEIISSPWIRAKPADLATLSQDILLKIFESAGKETPSRRVTTTIDRQELIPYCNSGVVVLPKVFRDEFIDRWFYWNRFILDNSDILGKHVFFSDQASFALSLSEFDDVYEELPVSLNFPAHFAVNRYPDDIFDLQPLLIHYHDWVDGRTGELKYVGIPGADRAIARVNQRIKDERSVQFSNVMFWDTRYLADPELGSGIGSRGDYVSQKARHINDLINDYKGMHVLDFGCGDCAILEEIEIPGYIGVDCSKVVIEANRENYPDLSFECAEISDYRHSAELSICFDVLIHQPDVRSFDCMLDSILQLTKVAGLINGFDYDPEFDSNIVFFHRPLGEALRSRGLSAMIVGEYRKTAIYRWAKACPEE